MEAHDTAKLHKRMPLVAYAGSHLHDQHENLQPARTTRQPSKFMPSSKGSPKTADLIPLMNMLSVPGATAAGHAGWGSAPLITKLTEVGSEAPGYRCVSQHCSSNRQIRSALASCQTRILRARQSLTTS